jgi:nucleotide-binding universal stress UspA family protein
LARATHIAFAMDLHKIVVATDFSPDAEAALDLALELTRSSHADVFLVHVCHMPSYAFFNGGLFVPLPSLFAEIVEDAKKALRTEQEKRARSGSALYTVCLEGEPALEVIRWAEENRADLIVMGTHGRRGLRRLLMGSVAEHVVRRAVQPVLTVHAKNKESAQEPTVAGAA